MTEIRVYIADLSAYVGGHLRGKWWDPTEFADAEDFGTAVQEWIEGTEDAPPVEAVGERGVYYNPEEYAIHDYEAPSGIRIEEYSSLDTVWGLANAIAEHGEAYADYVSNVGQEYATEEGFEEAYAGHYDSGEDYAAELFEDVYDVPEHLAPYIDYERVWRDLTFDGYWISDNGNVFRQ